MWGQVIGAGAGIASSILGGDEEGDRLKKVDSYYKRALGAHGNYIGEATSYYRDAFRQMTAGFEQARMAAQRTRAASRQQVLGREQEMIGDATQEAISNGTFGSTPYDVARAQIGYGTSNALVQLDAILADQLGDLYLKQGIGMAGLDTQFAGALERFGTQRASLWGQRADALSGASSEGGDWLAQLGQVIGGGGLDGVFGG